MELEEVVGGGDELPFGLNGGPAASAESGYGAQVLDVGKDRLDDLLASGVAGFAVVGGQQRADPVGVRALRWLVLAR